MYNHVWKVHKHSISCVYLLSSGCAVYGPGTYIHKLECLCGMGHVIKGTESVYNTTYLGIGIVANSHIVLGVCVRMQKEMPYLGG